MQVTGRQLGSALGAAILVAVVGSGNTAADFAGAWRFMLAASLLAGVALCAVGRVVVPARATSAHAGDASARVATETESAQTAAAAL